MTHYNTPYQGRKRSRTSRFPALPQDQARAITVARPYRCEGISDFGGDPVWLLPAGNSRVSTGIISGSRTVKDYELVTLRRELIIKSELVTTDGIETDRFYKCDRAIAAALTINTAPRLKCQIPSEPHATAPRTADCYRAGNKVGRVSCRCLRSDCYRAGNKLAWLNSLMQRAARAASGYTFSPDTNRPDLFVSSKPIWLIPNTDGCPPNVARKQIKVFHRL
jgi:hypothetical protein